MSIRKILLAAFIGISLLAAILLAGLGFVNARQALRSEIERGVSGDASALAAEIDAMLLERAQNASTWSRLDIMQDLQVRDVDKRLSIFLSDLRKGYGNAYLALDGLDTSRRVVASSDPARIGLRIAEPGLHAAIGHAGAAVVFARPAGPASDAAEMEVPIASSFAAGALGSLHLVLDWRRFDEVLDRIASEQGRLALIVDGAGVPVAASSAPRAMPALAHTTLATWLARSATGAGIARERDGVPIVQSQVIEAAAAFPTAGGTGLGWSALIAQPTKQAFAPVQAMGGVFALLLAAIVAISTAGAFWISRAISRPIVQLTDFVRQSSARDANALAPQGGSREVVELRDAFSAMLRDLQRSQAELVRAARLAAVGEMASMLAHEVRTPLGIMRSSAQMLTRESQLSSEGRELVGFIEGQTERLNRLVSRMLHIARPRAALREEADFAALVRGACVMLAPQQQAKAMVIETVDVEGVTLLCDADEITQVLLNLLGNALQAISPQGRVRVAARSVNEGVEFTVQDDGPGVPADQRPDIFGAFVSRREGGVGLGLAIVREIVVAHAGNIEVDDSDWGGARFRVWLAQGRKAAT